MKRSRIDREAAARPMDQPQRRFLELRDDQSVALPRIFAQLFHAFRHFHRTAELNGFEPGVIDLLGDRDHHAGAHVVGPKALLPVAQRGVDKTNFSHSVFIAQSDRGLNRGSRSFISMFSEY